MKNIKKNKIVSIATTFLLISSMFLLFSSSVFAQVEEGGSYRLPAGVTPDYEVQATPYLSFRPNPVGLNQIFLINMWITPATHVSRYHTDFKLTITKPSGEQHVVEIDSYRADSTAWMEWIADEVGEWRLKFDFQGSYFPAGDYEVYGGAWIGPQIVTFDESAYYKPASIGEQILTVQEDIVYSWPDLGLSTDYWTRPVTPEHREWWPILGYFPGTGVTGGGDKWNELYPDTNIYNHPDYEFVPWVQAPETSHIVWKRTENIGGLIGGVAGQKSWTSGGNTPSIIYAGRCFDAKTRVYAGETQSVWTCTDLRTGKVYWERTDVSPTPNFVMFEDGFSEVPGADPMSGRNVWLCSISGGTLYRYNPTSGDLSQEIDISPLTSGDLYSSTNFLSVQNLGGGNYRLVEWKLAVENLASLRTNIVMEVVRNITYPWRNFGDSVDYNVMMAADVTSINQPALGAYTGTNVKAVSLITGQQLYDFDVSETMYSSSTAVADHGKIAFVAMDGSYHAYDLQTGQKAWTSPPMDYPWSQPGFGSYDATSAYGMLFRQAYDGVYAFDWDNGNIVWHYKAPTPFEFETPYVDSDNKGVYSFNGASMIADGKLYTYNTEHTATQPITRGWSIHCIDVFTGEGIWNMTGGISQGAVADGYLTASSSYTGETIVFGKGKSATTVSAPQTQIPVGQSAMITGTVLDQSPAQPNTPCVSATSMTTQMEYLHMQRPIDGVKGDAVITGVPVTLTAISTDGSESVDIGITTTEGYYGTFGFAWTPNKEGTYEIVASFAGDDSYGSSAAATYIVVGPAVTPSEPIEPEPSAETPLITTEVAIAIAVIAAVAIGVVAYSLLRKRE